MFFDAGGADGVYSWNFLGYEQWPGINSDKTDPILFSRKFKIETFRLLRLGGREFPLSSEVKQLSVVLESKLNWKRNTEERMKGLNALYQCRNSIGKNWGLSLRAIRWIYLTIVRPVIISGCVVWWSDLDRSFQQKILDTELLP